MPSSTSTHFFTIVAQNYLAYAFVLGESLARHHPGASFSIVVVDDSDEKWLRQIESKGFSYIQPGVMGIEDFRAFSFQYNITELSTAIKPFAFQYLFAKGAEKVVYLDPDIRCFRSLIEVIDSLDRYSIVLTPHICSPVPDGQFPGEKTLLAAGVFNLGFLALRKDSASQTFLSWWAGHLEYECIADTDDGLFVDQKWIDLVPGCFENVLVLRDLSYNIAYWNLHERNIEIRDGVPFEAASGKPVAFYHFSGFSLDDVSSVSKYRPRNPLGTELASRRFTLNERPGLESIFRDYRNALIAEGVNDFSGIPYSYRQYDNGESISQLERSVYLHASKFHGLLGDPFATHGLSFWSTCRRSGIQASSRATEKLSAEDISNKYKIHMRVIDWFFRHCMKILGPDRYLSFAKYLRHRLLLANQGFVTQKKMDRLLGALDKSPFQDFSPRSDAVRTANGDNVAVPGSIPRK